MTAEHRHSAAARLFVALGRTAAYLPSIRGKTRIYLELYRLLGLRDRHVNVRARLRKPVRYVAELDLHAWLQRVAFLTGGYEPDTVGFLLRLYAAAHRSGGFLLDVGANVGLIAVPFAMSFPRDGVRVVAVEAVPDNVAALQRNVELNYLDEVVKLIPLGVGDACRIVEIQVEGDLHAGEGTGTANILPAESTHHCVRQALAIRTLDDLVGSGDVPGGCSVIKIDTDGYDLKVLQGGVALLRRDRPVIFGEFAAHCMNWHGQSLRDVLEFASGNDYVVWKREHPHWAFSVATENSHFTQDLLLIPLERVVDFHFCFAQ